MIKSPRRVRLGRLELDTGDLLPVVAFHTPQLPRAPRGLVLAPDAPQRRDRLARAVEALGRNLEPVALRRFAPLGHGVVPRPFTRIKASAAAGRLGVERGLGAL